MPPRRTERRHDLSRLMTAQPGQKVDKALILSNVGANLPGRKRGARKPVAAPWCRVRYWDERCVVLTCSLPPRVLSPNAGSPGKWRAKSAAVKAHRGAAAAAVTGLFADPWERATLRAAFFYGCVRKRDGENLWLLLKPHVDGLRDGGLIVDDSLDRLRRDGDPTVDIDRRHPRVELVIRRVE